MNIALVAHDSKKELMIQFCTAYCSILSNNNICATGVTGKMISDATGLEVTSYLGGRNGGEEQIAARIAYNEIDILLFFRDPLKDPLKNPEENEMLRLCDENNIPFATNIATAEALIHSLRRGDLEWRNITKANN